MWRRYLDFIENSSFTSILKIFIGHFRWCLDQCPKFSMTFLSIRTLYGETSQCQFVKEYFRTDESLLVSRICEFILIPCRKHIYAIKLIICSAPQSIHNITPAICFWSMYEQPIHHNTFPSQVLAKVDLPQLRH